MLKWIRWSSWLLGLWGANTYGTTVPNPSVRYTISNQTDETITALIQVESDNPRFTTLDTVGVIVNFREGLALIQSPHHTLKPYQKLIIQTNRQYYQTAPLAFDDRCGAYTIQITPSGLSIQADYSFILRRWVIEILIVVLFTLVIKGLPLLLITASGFTYICKPFFVLNGLFSLCLLVLLNFSFGRPVQAGPIELKYTYLTLGLISLLECWWYYQSAQPGQSRIRVLAGTVLGSLIWAFPGYLITVFARFLFAHC